MIPALNAGEHVTCREVLEAAGWRMEGRPGPTFTKFRAPDGAGVILASEHGWLDPKLPPGSPGSRGNAVALVRRIHSCSAVEARKRLQAIRNGGQAGPTPRPSPQQLWVTPPSPAPGSPGWRYLTEQRRIPAWTVAEAVAQGLLREGREGSIWALHRDAEGNPSGAEIRTPGKRPSFTGGGSKGAAALGPPPGE